MAYKLKSNNKKLVSGAKLRAKIVEPVSKLAIYRDYPVIVSVAKLTDQECVLRDYQQVDSILNSHNQDWDDKTKGEKVEDLNAALNNGKGIYGSTITMADPYGFSSYNDSDGAIIDQNGEVLRQPLYGRNDFKTTLSIKVSKGDAEEIFLQEITIPSLKDSDIAGQINLFWKDYTDLFWKAIKGNNINPSNVFAPFSTLNISEILSETFNGVVDIFSLISPDYVDQFHPTIDIHFPDFATIKDINTSGSHLIGNDNVTITKLSAADAYKLGNTSQDFIVQPVYIGDLTDSEKRGMGLSLVNNNFNIIVAYRIVDASNPKEDATSTISIDNGSTNVTATARLSGLGFLSNTIPYSTVAEQVFSNMKLSWFISLATYNVSASDNALTRNGSKQITVPPNTDIIIKIADGLNTLLTGSDTIPDNSTTPIGYSWGSTIARQGFTDKLVRVSVQSISTPMGITSSYPSTPVQSAYWDGLQKVTSVDISQTDDGTKYLVLNEASFTSNVTITFEVTCAACAIGSSTQTTTTIVFKPTT